MMIKAKVREDNWEELAGGSNHEDYIAVEQWNSQVDEDLTKGSRGRDKQNIS